MRVILEFIDGPYLGRQVFLRSFQSMSFGRTEAADYPMSLDGYLSGTHFQLKCDDQTCQLSDLNSRNGTLLNGEKVESAQLATGDVVEAGNSKFRATVEFTSSQALNAVAQHSTIEQPASSPTEQTPTEQPPIEQTPPAQLQTLERGRFIPVGAPEFYCVGLADDDVDVRQRVLHAAAWTRQPWLLDYCRTIAQQSSLEDWDVIMLLAIMGQPTDRNRVFNLGGCLEFGPQRFEIFGAYGHPAVLDDLVKAMCCDDPVAAVAAGAAFKKITGVDIDSDDLTTNEADDEEATVLLPNHVLAKEHLDAERAKYTGSNRWCGGSDMNGVVPNDVVEQLDLQSRWELFLRENYFGIRNHRPSDCWHITASIS